jgi:hypothetical protein
MVAGSVLLASPADIPGERRGLSTTFVEVQLGGVPIAGRYALDLKPIDVANNSGLVMTIHLEALVPRPDELRGGYDPIPDPGWIQFEPRDFTISPGGRGSSRVVIYTPDDTRLTGRKFEAALFIRGVAAESPSVGVGLKPRLYFSLAGRDRPDLVVTMDAAPRFPRVTPFESGVREGTMRFVAGHFTAQNQSGESMVYEIKADAAAIRDSGDGGAELLPNLAWVTVRPQTLVLPPWGSSLVGVEVNLPIEARFFGRAFVVPIHSVASRPGARPVDLYNRVVLVVPDPGKIAATGGR